MPSLASSLLGATVAACACGALAKDPSDSWLSYASFTAAGTITALNTTWVVPSQPKTTMGSNAPGWWFGIQTTEGDGALIQPILAWGYQGSHYTMFNGVFDWTDGSWHTSPEKLTVKSGDTMISSVIFEPPRTYVMRITSAATGQTITTPYTLEARQKAPETTAYFVLEHQPSRCSSYPTDGVCTFNNITMEVDNTPVTPKWAAHQQKPACDSLATIVDPSTIKFTWNPKAEADAKLAALSASKWTTPQ